MVIPYHGEQKANKRRFQAVGECNRDLNEAAGAADATACSRDGCFRGTEIFSERSGNMLLCQDFPFQSNSAVGVVQAMKWRNGHSKPILYIYSHPHPPQTPAASFKSPYRKCPGGTPSFPTRPQRAGAFAIGR